VTVSDILFERDGSKIDAYIVSVAGSSASGRRRSRWPERVPGDARERRRRAEAQGRHDQGPATQAPDFQPLQGAGIDREHDFGLTASDRQPAAGTAR